MVNLFTLASLKIMADEHGASDIVGPVLSDERFLIWSGAAYPHHHHFGDGGLLMHTCEVALLCMQNAKFFMSQHQVNMKELFVAAVYHDYGKVWDYQRGANGPNGWVPAKHKRDIHHISRSAMEWWEISGKLGVDQGTRDRVSHMILSHHGQRAYGSPVAPNSREAWLLHTCDMMSARMDDCDKHDILKHEI